MAVEIITHDNRLCSQGQEISTDWFADTAANRKSIVVFLRHFVKENGKRIFTHQELSKIVDSPNRAVSSEYIRSFKAARGDFAEFLTRKKKINIVAGHKGEPGVVAAKGGDPRRNRLKSSRRRGT